MVNPLKEDIEIHESPWEKVIFMKLMQQSSTSSMFNLFPVHINIGGDNIIRYTNTVKNDEKK